MAGMIDAPAFIVCQVANGTRITGRAVRYSDPRESNGFGAFEWEDAEGVSNFVLWAGIVHLTVFPLSAPNAPAPAAALGEQS